MPLELLHAAVTSIAAQPGGNGRLFVQRICDGPLSVGTAVVADLDGHVIRLGRR